MKPICYAYPMLDFTDDSGMGKLMAAMLAWMAEQERKMIVRRIKAGIAARRARGKRVGRRSVSPATQSRIRRLRSDGLSFRQIARELKISAGAAFKYSKAIE